MSELRWILLGAGIALILALWWWESRKARAAAARPPAEQAPSARAEPTVEPSDAATWPAVEAELPAIPTVERVRIPHRPPLIEIPEDFEVDVSDFVGRRRRAPEAHLDLDPDPGDDASAVAEEAANEEGEPVEEPLEDEHHRAPWVRTQPLERDEVAPKPEDEPPLEPEPTDPAERRSMDASRQRVVALRLIAANERWSGRALRAALEAEGLKPGPYSIFHREREDGKSLMFVADMMEPGSFDFARMDEQDFAGVSLFGVVPGPLDAPTTFDLVLTVGRALAERLKGQLQDEQGSTLTSQRILNLREELVHFEHRNRRLRRN